MSEHAAEALRERYECVTALRDLDSEDVEAGRRYGHAYVEYIHFVEKLHGLLTAAWRCTLRGRPKGTRIDSSVTRIRDHPHGAGPPAP